MNEREKKKKQEPYHQLQTDLDNESDDLGRDIDAAFLGD